MPFAILFAFAASGVNAYHGSSSSSSSIGGGGHGSYHHQDSGLFLFWFLLIAVGVFFCLFSVGGAWHWHSTRHVYRHGTRTYVDKDGSTRVERIDEHIDTAWPEDGSSGSGLTGVSRSRPALKYDV